MPGQGARRPTARHSTGAEPFAGIDGGGVAAVPIGLGVGLAGAAELMRIHSHPGGTYVAGWAREKKINNAGPDGAGTPILRSPRG